MRLMALTLVSLFLVLCSGCRKHYYNPQIGTKFNAAQQASLATSVVWLKAKRDAVDVLIDWHNAYPHQITISGQDVTLRYHGQFARCNKPGFWTLPAGLGTRQVLTFEFGRRIPFEGVAELGIASITGPAGNKLPSTHLRLPIHYQ